ncbi:MAG: chemotaxis protein CheD [Bacillota bacterium]|nr:chemotaxis protein CheD [Bacillota bacterium]
MQIAKCPEQFVTYALGSCIGICLYDSGKKIGGLGHIMLPTKPAHRADEVPFRYADTCIPLMVEKMEKMGAARRSITAKIAGGAKMFEVADDNSFGNIGERNSIAVKDTLFKLKIPVIAEDIGLNYGRTVFFYTETGIMVVKSFAKGTKSF